MGGLCLALASSRAIAAAALLLALGEASGAQPAFVLGDADKAQLDSGHAVIHEVKEPRDLSLKASGAIADELRSRVAALRPNYLSEVVFAAPRRDGAMDGLAAALSDVKGYVGIRYWSKRNETWYDLFDKMDVRSRTKADGSETIETWQHMEPFSDYGCRYTCRTLVPAPGGESELFFLCENTTSISFNGISAVSAGNMVWMLYAFPEGDRILFYGVGAVRAFDMFGVIRDRLQVSFMGRVESFFMFMSGKLGG
jgi:hypothetical protein